MTGNYKTERFDPEHTHFGGLIYLSDFYTGCGVKSNTNGSPIASHIEADFKWERKLYENHQKERKNRNTDGVPGKHD